MIALKNAHNALCPRLKGEGAIGLTAFPTIAVHPEAFLSA
jgi:hypothetical protein